MSPEDGAFAAKAASELAASKLVDELGDDSLDKQMSKQAADVAIEEGGEYNCLQPTFGIAFSKMVIDHGRVFRSCSLCVLKAGDGGCILRLRKANLWKP